jgi:hypothetical protein
MSLRLLRSASRLVRCPRGQSTVELVAFLPLVLAAGLAGATILAAQAAEEHAGQAAMAGAMALLHGSEPRGAAASALPAGARRRATILVRGRRVIVRVRPSLAPAALADRLTAVATADAGPEP